MGVTRLCALAGLRAPCSCELTATSDTCALGCARSKIDSHPYSAKPRQTMAVDCQ